MLQCSGLAIGCQLFATRLAALAILDLIKTTPNLSVTTRDEPAFFMQNLPM